MLADHIVHLAGFHILESRPAEVCIRASLGIFAFGKVIMLNGLLQPRRFVFFQRLEVIQPAKEKKVRDLLNNFERIGNASRPEGIPDPIDLIPDVTRYHAEIRLLETACREASFPAGSID